MPAAATLPSRRPSARLVTAVAVGAAGLAVTGGGVYAALTATATNTTAQSATSGVLSLTMNNNDPSFSQAVSDLAPGDRVNRYVTLTQGDDLDGKDLTLAVSDATPTPTLLTTNGGRGLKATITQCSVAWDRGTGACADEDPIELLVDAPLSTLASPREIKEALAAGSVLHLQVALTLPDQTETTINGVTPTDTIQGLSASLTWKFSETQRTAATTGS